jgi:inorganic triphosphatase YgiF
VGTSLFEAAFQLSGMTRAQVRQPRKHGVPLRVRRIGDCYVQTIKATSNGRLLERDEWESEIASEVPDLDHGPRPRRSTPC